MPENSVLSARARKMIFAAVAFGAAGFAAGVAWQPERAWPALLVSAFYFLSLAAGAALFVSIQHVSNAGWATVLRRVPEAMTAFLPVGAASLLSIYFGRRSIYEWVNTTYAHDDHELVFKNGWLSTPFFFSRMAVILGAWVLLAWLLRRESLRQDADGCVGHTLRLRKCSAVFLVVFALTVTVASFDWLMSVEPLFYSTIYAFYVIAGLLLAALAGVTLLTILLRRRGLLPQVNDGHLRNLGRLLQAFATFWAYIWLCQYLLVYYANLPEETVYYYRRTVTPGWHSLFLINILLNWIAPFAALLPRGSKRSERWLVAASCAVLAGHWVDLYVLVFPALELSPVVGFAEPALAFGLGALFLRSFWGSVAGAAPVPVRDPYLEESLRQEPREAPAGASA